MDVVNTKEGLAALNHKLDLIVNDINFRNYVFYSLEKGMNLEPADIYAWQVYQGMLNQQANSRSIREKFKEKP